MAKTPLTPDLPDDALLRDVGLAKVGRGEARVLLIACGALAHEVIALCRANAWDHIDLQCLPAILHNTPDRITPAVTALVTQHSANYAHISVIYGDCGTGGALQSACDRLGVSMIAGPHCYSFFEGNKAFAARDEMTAFYLTDFLVRQFDAFVIRPLGLDRYPQLRDTYFGNYETLVYLAQIDDPALTTLAESHAARLGLRFERRRTGYGDLAHHIADVALIPAPPPA